MKMKLVRNISPFITRGKNEDGKKEKLLLEIECEKDIEYKATKEKIFKFQLNLSFLWFSQVRWCIKRFYYRMKGKKLEFDENLTRSNSVAHSVSGNLRL